MAAPRALGWAQPWCWPDWMCSDGEDQVTINNPSLAGPTLATLHNLGFPTAGVHDPTKMIGSYGLIFNLVYKTITCTHIHSGAVQSDLLRNAHWFVRGIFSFASIHLSLLTEEECGLVSTQPERLGRRKVTFDWRKGLTYRRCCSRDQKTDGFHLRNATR